MPKVRIFKLKTFSRWARGLCKKRIAKAGREKSEPGADFTTANVAAAKLVGAALQSASIRELDDLVITGTLREIQEENGE